MRKIHSFWIVAIVLILLFTFISGYRLTAESAAYAHSFLPKDAWLVSKHNIGHRQMFIYNIEDYYMMIVPRKVGLLWHANASMSTKSINDKKDKVRTVGWNSYYDEKNSGTILVVDVIDDRVAYIEAGEENERIRKKVIPGKYVELIWDEPYYPHQIDPVALSEKGAKLYAYNYGKYTYTIDHKELRWHEVD